MTKRSLAGVLAAALVMWSSGDIESVEQPAQESSFDKGQRNADRALESIESVDETEATAGGKLMGYLVAEGDSWFAYPGLDVLGALSGKQLQDRAYYRVYSSASAGDTVESMAYDTSQLEGFASEFRKIFDAGKQKEVKAILLSGGGNDIAGREFHILLNHAQATGIGALDVTVANAFIDRIGRSMESLIGSAARFSTAILKRRDIPILIHGYAPPVPDGRPFLIGWPLPGPWLQPGFAAKGYITGRPNELSDNTAVMADLIGRFNDRIARIPEALKSVADVRYVDLRATLRNTVPNDAYKVDWSNELHPRDAAFTKVATAFHARIQGK